MLSLNRYISPALVLLLLTLAALPVRTQEAALVKAPKVVAFKRQPTSAAVKWANEELRRMSIEEKVGQLISVGINATFLNQESDAYRTLKHHIEDNKVGGIILFRGPVYESVILVNRMQQLAKYPLLISADLEAGAGMRFDDTVNFPWNMAVAATGNPDYARRQGEITAREARALGIQQIFAPVVDVNNNAANPVINVRSYGEDPADVARFAAAFTEGAQAAGAIATAKHFPGHGDTAVDSHRGLPEINVSRDRLNNVEFVPFQASINAGVASVMVGHIALPQIDSTAIKPLPRNLKGKAIDTDEAGEIVDEKATMPATLSPVMGNILRNDLKFPGLIVTDALSMSGLTIYFTPEEAAVRALEAGADMLLKPADVDAAFRGVRDAVKSGRISEARVEESSRKILAALARLRAQLPDEIPLSGIRVSALGNTIMVRTGPSQWDANTGQLAFDFEVADIKGDVVFLDASPAKKDARAQAHEWYALADQLAADGEAGEAEHAYRKALAVSPLPFYGAYVDLGALLCEDEGRCQDALVVFDEAIACFPEDAVLHFNRAVALELLGRLTDAEQSYARCLEINPSYADAHHNLALVKEQLGDKQGLVRHMSAYRKLSS